MFISGEGCSALCTPSPLPVQTPRPQNCLYGIFQHVSIMVMVSLPIPFLSSWWMIRADLAINHYGSKMVEKRGVLAQNDHIIPSWGTPILSKRYNRIIQTAYFTRGNQKIFELPYYRLAWVLTLFRTPRQDFYLPFILQFLDSLLHRVKNSGAFLHSLDISVSCECLQIHQDELPSICLVSAFDIGVSLLSDMYVPRFVRETCTRAKENIHRVVPHSNVILFL